MFKKQSNHENKFVQKNKSPQERKYILKQVITTFIYVILINAATFFHIYRGLTRGNLSGGEIVSFTVGTTLLNAVNFMALFFRLSEKEVNLLPDNKSSDSQKQWEHFYVSF